LIGLLTCVDYCATSHSFAWAGAGSPPKVVLLQAILPVATLEIQIVTVPYRTVCVPLKVQIPPSFAHLTQFELVVVGDGDAVGVTVGLGDGVADAVGDGVEVATDPGLGR
jgi:hypothetical protein